MDVEKLHKFALNAISSEKEINEILDWIEDSEANYKKYTEIKNLWAHTVFFNFEQGKNNLPKIINVKRRKTLLPSIMKYAAILIMGFSLTFLTYYLYTTSNKELVYNKVIVPLGESAEIILADNTHVWLNSGAILEYPSQFSRKNRDVKLIGEAYFEVNRNEEKPFHVITSYLTVEVLGTSFNVDAFERSRLVNVTLVEGKVELEKHSGEHLAMLLPGENAVYDVSLNTLNIAKVNTTFYTSWKDGIMIFKDEKLADIAEKLERWYSVDIIFDDPSVKEIKFTGAILKNKPIDQILEILKYTSGINYSMEIKTQNPSIIHLKKKSMKY